MADKYLRVSEKTHEDLQAALAATIGKRKKPMSLRAFTDEVIANGLRRIRILTRRQK